MARITFEMDADEMTAMADMLLRRGQVAAARQLYRKAKSAGSKASLPLASRLGLAGSLRKSSHAPMLTVLEEVERMDPKQAFVGEGLATWHKTPPFVDDARFMALVDTHAELLPVAAWHWNLQTVIWAVNQVKDLPGDFVELGVFRGHTTRFVADYLDFGAWRQTWSLFDTFEGIPEDQLDPGWAGANQRAYADTFSFEEVVERFAGFPNIKVIKGRVPEILQDNAPETISFLHMDLNNVTAEIQALDALFDRITPGGVIVFDDYCWSASIRQRRAEEAWMAERGLRILAMPTGQGLFIKA